MTKCKTDFAFLADLLVYRRSEMWFQSSFQCGAPADVSSRIKCKQIYLWHLFSPCFSSGPALPLRLRLSALQPQRTQPPPDQRLHHQTGTHTCKCDRTIHLPLHQLLHPVAIHIKDTLGSPLPTNRWMRHIKTRKQDLKDNKCFLSFYGCVELLVLSYM